MRMLRAWLLNVIACEWSFRTIHAWMSFARCSFKKDCLQIRAIWLCLFMQLIKSMLCCLIWNLQICKSCNNCLNLRCILTCCNIWMHMYSPSMIIRKLAVLVKKCSVGGLINWHRWWDHTAFYTHVDLTIFTLWLRKHSVLNELGTCGVFVHDSYTWIIIKSDIVLMHAVVLSYHFRPICLKPTFVEYNLRPGW